MTDLTIIIPTLNEAQNLPRLLESLKAQTRPPEEIIIADAGSKDNTVSIAGQFGARVVPGGMPGPGRNAGACAARGDIFLFLDADVLPAADFLALGLKEFERGRYAVATCPIEALSSDLADRVLMDATNLYIQLITPVSPRAPGFCIFARREVHEAIGGFDETLRMSEDHDYVRRASKYGRFGLLTSIRIPVSMRRLEKEGLVRLAVKYLWCEMYALAGRPIRSLPFEYEFGAFEPASQREQFLFVDIAQLRSRLGSFENPITALSRKGLEQLQRISESEGVQSVVTPARLLLERHDAAVMERYLQLRLAITRRQGSMVRRWTRWKRIPREMVGLLDRSWLPHSFRPDKSDHEDF